MINNIASFNTTMKHSEIPLKQEIQTLETERLLIRVSPEACYKQAFESLSDGELKLAFGITSDTGLTAEKYKIANGITNYRTSLVFFHLMDKISKVVVGSFAFHNWFPMHRRSEIGYAMNDEEYKNRGYMKEAFPAILNFGFEQMNLNRMEAFIHPDNIPSQRLVLAHNFTKEGVLSQHYFSNEVYGDSIAFGRLRNG